MTVKFKSQSQELLSRLRDLMSKEFEGQERLDKITKHIAKSMATEVCSIYLYTDADTLELCATTGLNRAAVHKTRMRTGEGLVGRVAQHSKVINTANAPAQPGFRFMPETGEQVFSSFVGVPIRRPGDTMGVLVVQSVQAREFDADGVYALEVVAMILAEMTELGAFVSESAHLGARHKHPVTVQGINGQDGSREGHVWLHEPRVVVTKLVCDDPTAELERLAKAIDTLRSDVDDILEDARDVNREGEHIDILYTYRMFAHSKSWVKRLEADIMRGMSAEAAVEKEQSAARARLDSVPDVTMRERLMDLDDLSNRLLRLLTGQTGHGDLTMPPDAILVARNIGPAELLEYTGRLKGIVLEQGSVGSHAGIVARALAIPLVVQAEGILIEALNKDHILVDGDSGTVHLRPDEAVTNSFRDKMAMQAKAQKRYEGLRDKPAVTLCGTRQTLLMNAGLLADLPSMENCGAEGVGLFRTELQFLASSKMPKPDKLVEQYARVLTSAKGLPVVFRTIDIGSDKIAPYFKREDEPNPAMGWRALRVGLDRPGILRMQFKALLKAASGKELKIMFPMVAQFSEFIHAKRILMQTREMVQSLGYAPPSSLKVGAMIETPSMVFAPDAFFEEADFLSVGGNDIKQFFFASDRENERVRRRYDTLNIAFLDFLQLIVKRAEKYNTSLSYCGEDAGRPYSALAMAALGYKTLSMRPASIGPVKSALLRNNLNDVRQAIANARNLGEESARAQIQKVVQL